jgi:hypothetical protein
VDPLEILKAKADALRALAEAMGTRSFETSDDAVAFVCTWSEAVDDLLKAYRP